MKTLCCLIMLISGCALVAAQNPSKINWKSWTALEQALQKEPKPVFVFFHATWCAYCKKIKRKVFTKEQVIQKINTDYYALEMDVERTDTISFGGQTFANKQALTKRNGVHELALSLASREQKPFTLPATILLKEDFTIKNRLFEYYTAPQLMTLLQEED